MSAPNSSQLYEYRRLNSEIKEIRLVELLPGAFEENIRVKIHHASLAPPSSRSAATPSSRDEIQKTLSSDWVVRVCLDGRFIFERVKEYGPEEPYETSWTHPVTGADFSLDFGNNELEYEGLSYVWAPVGGENDIHVLGIGSSSATPLSSSLGTIPVRPNLASALRHLRYRDRSRRLWIDALCINQADLPERSKQVGLMSDIYKRANRVVVWLGAERENSKVAISALTHLGEQVMVTDGGAWKTTPPGCSDPSLGRSAVPLPFDGFTWRAIVDLLSRQWFERLWVWQEVRLADDRSIMVSGFDIIPLTLFRRAIFCASDKQVLPTAQIRGLILDAMEVMLPFSNQPFFRELQSLSWKGCADPRDKIYGAMGAAPRSIKDHLKPNYSLSVEEVYKEFCRVYMEQTKRLDFLDRCNMDTHHIKAPSWIPDWSVSVDRAVRLPYADIFYAAGASMCDIQPNQDSSEEVLRATGVRCGTVCFVGKRAPPDHDGVLSTVGTWRPKDIMTGTYDPTGEPLINAFVTLLGLGYMRERWPQCNSLLSTPEATKLYTKGIGQTPTTPKDQAVSQSINFVRVRNRHFIRTDTGYLGTSHATPKVGDVLVVLLGCPSPLLLRPREVGKGHFQVIGPTYTHGLMDTEALLGQFPSPWRARMSRETGFFDSMHFFNSSTGQATKDDPRLGDDPPEWERLEARRTSDDPWNFARYRNR